MAERTGWDAVGYGLAGGFEKDRTERQKIQDLDAAKAGLQYDISTKSYKPMTGSAQDLQAQENIMLKQQLQEVQNGLVTDKQWGAIVDSVQTNNFDTFNNQINTDPKLQKIFKQDLGIQAVHQLNLWDNDKQLQVLSKAGMNPDVIDYIKKQRNAILNGAPEEISKDEYEAIIKDVGNAYPIIEKADGTLEATSLDAFLSKTNLLKNATKTSERQQVLDAIAMGKQALTGITDAAYKASLQGAKGTAESLQAKGTLDTSTTAKVVQANEIMSKAMATGSAEEVLKAFQITNPELYLKTTRGTDSKRDSLQQYMEALDLAKVPKNEQPAYIEKWIQKTTEGVGAVAKETDVMQLGGDRDTARKLFTPEGASKPIGEWKVDARTTQDKILSNMDEKEKTGVFEAQKTLETNHGTASMVENLLKGDFKKVDKDVIANAKTWLLSNTGIESKQAIENIKFDTQAGMMLAGLIKEMSGTAAGDPEVARLLKNFLGGNFTDERYIKETMKSFANYLRTKNNTLGKQYKDTLPYTVGTTTNLKPKSVKPIGGNKGTRSGPTAANLPPLVFPGKTQKTTGKPAASSFWKD